MQVLLECCYIWMESSQWEHWNHLFCRKVLFLTTLQLVFRLILIFLIQLICRFVRNIIFLDYWRVTKKRCVRRSKTCIRIGDVMVSVLASSAVDRGFEPQSGQITDYEIGIRCFSAKHAVLRGKSKDWLARNQDNVSEWNDMSIRRLLFQWASTIKKKYN